MAGRQLAVALGAEHGERGASKYSDQQHDLEKAEDGAQHGLDQRDGDEDGDRGYRDDHACWE